MKRVSGIAFQYVLFVIFFMLVVNVCHQGGAHPSVQLTAGQETSVQVSFGRKDNIVGSITASRLSLR